MRLALNHCLRIDRNVSWQYASKSWISKSLSDILNAQSLPAYRDVAAQRNRMISRPPIQDLAEPRLNSSAQFSFSRRRLSRRSLTNRVNYGLCYQPARRLDGLIDAVGRVKIQEGPIGAGWSIGYRSTANEKITCLALSAGLRNRNRLGPTFLFFSSSSFLNSFCLHRRPADWRGISWERPFSRGSREVQIIANQIYAEQRFVY